MSFGAGTSIWKLGFQLSPIMLTGGIAGGLGGMLPIIAFTQAVDFVAGILSGTVDLEMDDFFAHFQPLPGSTLIDVELGNYPFANQTIAANAIIKQPLRLSMLMRCPVRNELSYFTKLATMTLLQQVLDYHSSNGGTYTVITPAQIYTNGILKTLRDVSDQESKQVQNAYMWDFEFPLITLAQAAQAQNSLMGQLTAGTQVTSPTWSGVGNSISAPNSLIGSSIIPTSTPLQSSIISPLGSVA